MAKKIDRHITEIRIHGRGGQGAVTTGQLIAIAAFYDNKQCQTFPFFGLERTGAPVEAYVRISNQCIGTRTQVYHPDMVLVLDSTLSDVVDVTAGLKENGLLIINTNKKPAELGIKGDLSNFKVYCVDATAIANKIFGSPIVNTAVIGALAAASGIISLDSINKAIEEKFEKTKGKKISDLNKQAVSELFNQTK
ncbi:MAG: 2-oxoacid:acceptor oxidoreductase family protein [Nanoarchaeota archaeon]|nr:2-oxoacid:acceptor oxidoreductase family protein [Nanoarchaeota archaeon]